MELNAKFNERVVIDTRNSPWVSSPVKGIDRNMLDRVVEEYGRETRI